MKMLILNISPIHLYIHIHIFKCELTPLVNKNTSFWLTHTKDIQLYAVNKGHT